jgi:hygromycin-B 7''-O-kinase
MTLASNMNDGGLAEARARTALLRAGLEPAAELFRASSVTNEVWLTAEHVVRVNRTANHRLRREALLGPWLPPEVRYPPVVAHGTETGSDWLVLRRVPGKPLSRCWPQMSFDQRRSAIRQIAEMLKALHGWECTLDLAPIEAPHLLDIGTHGGAVGPVLAALEAAMQLDHVDPGMLREVIGIVEHGAQALEPFTSTTLIHGDLTFENVLWDQGTVTAMLDFEWARLAPRDLELDILLRFCAYPFLHVAEDYEHLTKAAAYSDIPWWLAEDHPALFDFARQIDRMRVYSIAYDVRELLQFPPSASPRRLSEYHPYHRLVRLVQRRSYLDDLGRALV